MKLNVQWKDPDTLGVPALCLFEPVLPVCALACAL